MGSVKIPLTVYEIIILIEMKNFQSFGTQKFKKNANIAPNQPANRNL